MRIGFPYTQPVIPPSPQGFNSFFYRFPHISLIVPLVFLVIPPFGPLRISYYFLGLATGFYRFLLTLALKIYDVSVYSTRLAPESHIFLIVLSWVGTLCPYTSQSGLTIDYFLQNFLHTCTQPNCYSWVFLQAGRFFQQNSPDLPYNLRFLLILVFSYSVFLVIPPNALRFNRISIHPASDPTQPLGF